MEKALGKQLGKKPKAMALNMRRARQAASTTPRPTCRSRIRSSSSAMNETAGKILIEGNAAAALGCMMAGVTVVAWYPITPSSSLCESLIDYLQQVPHRQGDRQGDLRRRPGRGRDRRARHGDRRDAGRARASMTSTAGPGISLMAEFAGLAYYAEMPAVIFDVQRVGPSTGLPTRTAQQDIAFAAVPLARRLPSTSLLLPSSVAECYTMAQDAFDLAERLQTPVFVMSDLDLGMNNWMSRSVRVPGQAARPRQGARRRDAEAARRLGPLQGRRRRRHPLPHAARRPACRPTSPAAPATTRRRCTASGRTTTSTTSIA